MFCAEVYYECYIKNNEYLSNIKNNEIARKVKIADLTHNSDINRIKNVNEKDLDRQQKYLKAIEYLSS